MFLAQLPCATASGNRDSWAFEEVGNIRMDCPVVSCGMIMEPDWILGQKLGFLQEVLRLLMEGLVPGLGGSGRIVCHHVVSFL